jgi:LuxR family transcriptional regulator, maltose regulon positive regulatory protein
LLKFPGCVHGSCEYNSSVIGLLPTKFYFPPIPSGFVVRPQLQESLDLVLTHRLTLVSAPAGAGKTTLVSAWVQSAPKKGLAFGWLSLDSADNDPVRFLEYLAACLEEGGTVIDISAFPTGQGEQGQLELALAELIRGLMDLKQEVILILDDYHLIQNKLVHRSLQYFLDHVPAHLHLILLTRSDPPLELARLRVAGQLAELRMEQMRFSVKEAGTFLEKTAGVQLAERDVTVLNSRAEGWIAGLQMAAISLRGAEDPSNFIASFAGSHRYVFDYLIEQVLDRQSPEMREFLLKTSMLERFSAPLCDAVVGTAGTARRMLDAIERANLFLVPLDDEHGWYRYHHLFSDLLKLVLEHTHPGSSLELHHLACHWYETQGMLPEALHHGLAAGDMELVANIVSENVLALVEHAEIIPTLAQIDAIPVEQRTSLPWLELAYAWGLAYIGHNQEASLVLSLAEQHIAGLPDGKRDKALGHIAAVQAYLAWTDGNRSAQAVEYARKADELLPPDEIAVRALNLTTLGNALTQDNDDTHAAAVLEKALLLAQKANLLHVVMQAASGLAYTLILIGKSRQARAVCENAIGIAESYQRRNSQPLTSAASVYGVLSRVLLEAGEFEKALLTARKSMGLGELWGQEDTIMLCTQFLAYALAFTNQKEKAIETIQEARKVALKGPPWHLQTLDYAEFQIYLDSDPQDDEEIRQEAARNIQLIEMSKPVAIRVLIKQHRLVEALHLLEDALAGSGKYGPFIMTWLFALQALALFQQKKQVSALQALQEALVLAEPDNLVVTFVREGSAMERLLRLPQAKAIAPVFVSRVLAAFESRRRYIPEPVPMEELIEPLSDRELEVLQRLNSYLSTPEIADLLVVSANTVRTHIKNIYGKLGVHGRSGAIRRATELGLLT